MVPAKHLRPLGTVFQALKSMLTDQSCPDWPITDVRLVLRFQSCEASGRDRPLGRLDLVRDLFRVIFDMIERPDLNPMRSKFASTAKATLVETSTALPKPDPGQLNIPKLVNYLRSHPLRVDQDVGWLALRNRTILLYCLSLGRRPSNASVALLPPTQYVTNWGLKVKELGCKKDRSRVGSSVFIEFSSHPETCLARHLLAYINHPTSKRLASCLSVPAPRLFLQLGPGAKGDHSITKATCSSVISAEFKQAEVDRDSTGAKVEPRDIRSAVFSRCMFSDSLKSKWVRHMQAWAGKGVQERHYMRGKSPHGWHDFVLCYSDSVVPGVFVSVTEPPSSPTSSSSSQGTSNTPSTLAVSLVECPRQ